MYCRQRLKYSDRVCVVDHESKDGICTTCVSIPSGSHHSTLSSNHVWSRLNENYPLSTSKDDEQLQSLDWINHHNSLSRQIATGNSLQRRPRINSGRRDACLSKTLGLTIQQHQQSHSTILHPNYNSTLYVYSSL
jgi:hypothetical protein